MLTIFFFFSRNTQKPRPEKRASYIRTIYYYAEHAPEREHLYRQNGTRHVKSRVGRYSATTITAHERIFFTLFYYTRRYKNITPPPLPPQTTFP